MCRQVWLLPLGIILFEDTLYVLQEEMPGAFNDSVQVRHSGNATAARDMRKQLHIFVVEEDICVGKSKAKANKKYGDGGATQYYIRDMDKPKLTSTGNLRSFRR